MFPKLYSLGFGCSFAEEPGWAGQAVCSIRRVWKHLLKEGMRSLNGSGEMSWRSWAQHYSQMAQAGSEWAAGLEGNSVESGREQKGKTTEKQRMYCAGPHACSVLNPARLFFDPFCCNPPASFVHGIFQASILEWVVPFPIPGDLPNPGIEPASLASPAMAGRFFTTAPPGKPEGTMFRAKCPEGPGKGPGPWSDAQQEKCPDTEGC